jgi:arabinogalactan endo-1,4-beta-galactosidase
MLSRGVYFDVIGESYYPKWHGTRMTCEIILAISPPVIQKTHLVVDISQLKKEVNDIAFASE